MAYNEELAQRIRETLISVENADIQRIQEKRMFGGLCFMLKDHMACGVVGDRLMARVGPDLYQHCLTHDYCTQMDFTGKPMKGFVYVTAEGIKNGVDLQQWLGYCVTFVNTLPPKTTKGRSTRSQPEKV